LLDDAVTAQNIVVPKCWTNRELHMADTIRFVLMASNVFSRSTHLPLLEWCLVEMWSEDCLRDLLESFHRRAAHKCHWREAFGEASSLAVWIRHCIFTDLVDEYNRIHRSNCPHEKYWELIFRKSESLQHNHQSWLTTWHVKSDCGEKLRCTALTFLDVTDFSIDRALDVAVIVILRRCCIAIVVLVDRCRIKLLGVVVE
jgi:hypothetical protein